MTSAPFETPTTTDVATTGTSVSKDSTKGSRVLPDGWKPNEDTVIIGRGKKVTNHSGNRRFQDLIQAELVHYSRAPSKTEKSYILAKILHQVQKWSGKDRIGFVKQDPKNSSRWLAPKDSVARVTVAQAFRDALSGRYSSSKHSKQRRRQIAKGYISDDSSTTAATTDQDNSYSSHSSRRNSSTAAANCPDVKTAAMSLRSFVHNGWMRSNLNHNDTPMSTPMGNATNTMMMNGNTASGNPGRIVQDTLAQVRNYMQQQGGGACWNNNMMGNNQAMMTPFANQANTSMPFMNQQQMAMHSQMRSQMQSLQQPAQFVGMPSNNNLVNLNNNDAFEPVPIDEGQLFQQRMQQSNNFQSSSCKPRDDAFFASEQSSSFFLSGGPSASAFH